MDQHPIPQDVTGFQFKLIGTMTVKQFGFVATGVVMAVILYYLPLKTPLSLLIKLIFIPLLGAGGAIIAFVPIDGRPIDVMTMNFMKALFSPNQYIYHRSGKTFSFSKIADAKVVSAKAATATKAAAPVAHTPSHDSENKEEQLRVLLMGAPRAAENELDKKEAAFLSTIGLPTKQLGSAPAPQSPFKPSLPPITTSVKQFAPAVLPPQPTQPPVQAPVQMPPVPQQETPATLSQKESELEKELTLAKQQELQVTPPQEHLVAQQKVSQIETQIQQIHQQKQTLEQELSKLQSQLHQEKNPAVSPPAPATPIMSQPAVAVPSPAPVPAPQPVQAKPQETAPAQDPSHVRTIPQEITKKAGLPHVSDTPNVVVGIVKDPRGNVLSNILVEVKDREGNPVRAFKTNALGQFASATPLSSGTYTMELEDPKKLHRFDVIQVTANNQIMLPIEVISHDAREELRQQLFAQ